MTGLTNAYIDKFGKDLFGKEYLGCHPCDSNPRINKRKQFFSIIFNLSKHNDKEGTHFIAVYANPINIIYFDSFGKSCSNKYIKKFIKINKHNRILKMNKTPIQHLDSIYCGFFCLAFIISQKKNIQMKNFINVFDSKHLKKNDNIVIEFIINEIKNCNNTK